MSTLGNFASGDAITPEQDERMVRAIATYKARCAAYAAGASLSEIESYEWAVKLHEPMSVDEMRRITEETRRLENLDFRTDDL